MPDKNGKFSDREHILCNEKFEGYEKQMGRDLPCEVCGHIVWRLNSHLLMALGDSSRGVLGSKVRTPLVNYYCTNCGNMKFFSAHLWGMRVEPEPVAEKSSQETSDGD